MKNLGNIFSLLAALVAIAAAVLSFMISDRRAEFKGRADKLAVGLAKMAEYMDEKSDTNVANNASFTPANQEAGTAEEGTLGWKAFHDAKDESGTFGAFQQTVDEVVKQSQDLTKQRNDLAEITAAIVVQLAIPDTELDPGHLTTLADQALFTKATGNALSHATAVANRDRSMADALLKAAEDIDHPVKRADLTTREQATDEDGKISLGDFQCRMALSNFNTQVSGLKTRSDEYAQTITESISRITKHAWAANPEKLRDEREYAGVLTTLLNDFDDINEKLALYDKAKVEVSEQKLKIADLEEDLDDMRDDLQRTQDELVKTKQKLESVAPGGKTVLAIDDPNSINMNLEGEVLSINDEWNYVIIGLGKQQVKENMEMLIAREDKLIARVHISKVHSKICIAEILPEVNTGPVKVGDRAIFSALVAN